MLPFTETGYRSHFLGPGIVEEAGGPAAYVRAWLDHAAQSPKWRKQQTAARQQRRQFGACQCGASVIVSGFIFASIGSDRNNRGLHGGVLRDGREAAASPLRPNRQRRGVRFDACGHEPRCGA
jgi:hypothetical protein